MDMLEEGSEKIKTQINRIVRIKKPKKRVLKELVGREYPERIKKLASIIQLVFYKKAEKYIRAEDEFEKNLIITTASTRKQKTTAKIASLSLLVFIATRPGLVKLLALATLSASLLTIVIRENMWKVSHSRRYLREHLEKELY